MSDNTATPETETPTEDETTDTEQVEPTFTQADLDRIVGERIQRERAKFADYDELKSKANKTVTVEERLAGLEKELTQERATALRATVAARFGVSTEPGPDGDPSDADMFLTGTDEETLTAQAQRLAARTSERRTQSNVVPTEGANPRPTEDPMSDFAKDLFSRAKQ